MAHTNPDCAHCLGDTIRTANGDYHCVNPDCFFGPVEGVQFRCEGGAARAERYEPSKLALTAAQAEAQRLYDKEGVMLSGDDVYTLAISIHLGLTRRAIRREAATRRR